MSIKPSVSKNMKQVESLPRVTIRFAGDSGDGMQLTGMQFTNTSAVFGNDVSTLPDYPAEIRAPAGTVYGVSGYQLQFSSTDIFTPGDMLDVLVAMNPAALKVNVGELRSGGIILANEDGFTSQTLKLAGYDSNPLEDQSLGKYVLHPIPMTRASEKACEGLDLGRKEVARCKNFFALGIVCWLFSRPLDPIINFINEKFSKQEVLREANITVLKAGFHFGETAELFSSHYRIEKAKLPSGVYREIRGNQAIALGLVAASQLSGKSIVYGSYPITPASDILHEIARHKEFGVKTIQAEDEIAAVCAAIGASYGGALGVTASSGPGIALKAEAMGLAVMLELPLIVVNVQRGGPSTGLPTKTEQADLFQAILGRNGECPLPVLAPRSPSDCFDTTIEAVRLAARLMTPVMILSDGYIANSAEPWLIPDASKLEPIEIDHLTESNGSDGEFLPYLRDELNSRPWVLPGTPGLAHRVGGLEKQHETGNVNYDPENHEKMVTIRQNKVDGAVNLIPELKVFNDEDGTADVLLVGWGSTYGVIREANKVLIERGYKVANIHIRHLNPFPSNLEEILNHYRDRHVIVPELNSGQLLTLLRAKYLVDAKGLNKIQGRPFVIQDIVEAVESVLKGEEVSS
jgi:2-oxoglutarate ferredoxin oxidoreductase subunit alpha